MDRHDDQSSSNELQQRMNKNIENPQLARQPLLNQTNLNNKRSLRSAEKRKLELESQEENLRSIDSTKDESKRKR